MRINVTFGLFYDIVEFKPFLGKRISKYKKAFDRWYYERDEIGGIGIMRQRSTLPYKYLDTNVIIDWMLEMAPDCEAHILKSHIPIEERDNSLPGLCF